jgi:endonuclease/exonuclease/phosphatase family metal-dependent hydrolase
VPYYADMNPDAPTFAKADWDSKKVRRRVTERLLAIRARLDAAVEDGGIAARPPGTLIVGSWNLREFDSGTWGLRLPETYAYIAEVCSRFDIVALQEVRESLTALEKLRSRLGRHWEYIVSDVTDRSGQPGNGERLAFLYDTRKVRFLGQAGEMVLSPLRKDGRTIPAQQIARTPLMAAFQVGWTQFVLTTVHIVWGSNEPSPAARVDEIRHVARFLGQRSETKTEMIHNYIVVGDFNITATDAPTMKALQDGGSFTVPPELIAAPGSNVDRTMKYDQIAYRNRPERFAYARKAGVFDYYETVFTDRDEKVYRPFIDAYIKARRDAGEKSPKPPKDARDATGQYRLWRTYQMSDHLPLWAAFDVDFADEYLMRIRAGAGPRTGPAPEAEPVAAQPRTSASRASRAPAIASRTGPES